MVKMVNDVKTRDADDDQNDDDYAGVGKLRSPIKPRPTPATKSTPLTVIDTIFCKQSATSEISISKF